jgi:molybdate transport system permease protein
MRSRAERLPVAAVGLAAVAVLFLALPLAGLVARAPWRSLWSELAAEDVRMALRL